jgi:hypothetical protein
MLGIWRAGPTPSAEGGCCSQDSGLISSMSAAVRFGFISSTRCDVEACQTRGHNIANSSGR